MKLLKTFTLKWWETGLFKLGLLSIGIIIGAMWPDIFRQWLVLLWILFIIPSGYVAYIWWKQ